MNKKDLRKVFRTLAILFFFTLSTVIGYSFYFLNRVVSTLPAADMNKIYSGNSTKVYDAANRLIAELGVERRDVVKYNDISENMVHAAVAVEDERFFSHHGIDYKRIFGALYDNLRSYRFKEGASTLTQQLVKLSYLSQEKTIDRKLKEMFLSLEVEKRLSKEEIMEAYLNKVLFGGRIYGVEKASHYYFNKHAKDLTYEEAALLAGMVQSPNRYNPLTHPDMAKSRQITVLNAMYNNQYITKDELETAVKKPLSVLLSPQKENDTERFNEYIDQVIYEVEKKYGLNPFAEDLKIYTNMNTDIERYVQKLENDDHIQPNKLTQTGIIVLETGTGKVAAIGGGRNYGESMSFNFATDAKRQPGSTIKPILDYGPAMEYLKYSPGEPYLDDKIYYGTLGSRYVPVENYDFKYKGYLTMREAIIDSRNVTAIKAFREVGPERAYEFANQLGIKTDEPITEAHAIGGYEYGFTVLQMAGAYATFGNGGYYNEPATIRLVVVNNGQSFGTSQLPNRAMSSETAYLMTDILHDNMLTGTAVRANVKELILAGKTGQTNYDEETRKKFYFPDNSVRDSWFIGYSSKYTTAVWLGYDKITPGAFLTPVEARRSLDMFRLIMAQIHQDPSLSRPFVRPADIKEVEIETHTVPISLPSSYTPAMYRRKELFVEGTEPKIVSERFKPLERPYGFSSYYDDEKGELVFNWERENNDFNNEDFDFMETIHQIENEYDTLKQKTQSEFLKHGSGAFYPSSLSSGRIKTLYQSYCAETESELCGLHSYSLKTAVELLDTLEAYEIGSANNRHLPILSEGEISEIRGYRIYNGFRNGLYVNLGNIEYRIVGKKGNDSRILYQGPYASNVKIPMTIDEYLSYDAFGITADYNKYRSRLSSPESISLNPFYGFD